MEVGCAIYLGDTDCDVLLLTSMRCWGPTCFQHAKRIIDGCRSRFWLPKTEPRFVDFVLFVELVAKVQAAITLR